MGIENKTRQTTRKDFKDIKQGIEGRLGSDVRLVSLDSYEPIPWEMLCVTHSGVFHADEVFATAILFKVFNFIALARVADPAVSGDYSYVVYDIGNGELDHHQKEGGGVRTNGVPYASAGLVLRKYGKALFKDCTNADECVAQLDEQLIQGIDAYDNGMRDAISNFHLGNIISGFNCSWNNQTDNNHEFLKALAFAVDVLENTVRSIKANQSIAQVVSEMRTIKRGSIGVLNTYIPVRFLADYLTSKQKQTLRYVVYPAARGGYNWQEALDDPTRDGSLLPWCAMEQDDLRKTCGVPDAVFCHRSGFLGVAESEQGAIDMAAAALTFFKQNEKNSIQSLKKENFTQLYL